MLAKILRPLLELQAAMDLGSGVRACQIAREALLAAMLQHGYMTEDEMIDALRGRDYLVEPPCDDATEDDAGEQAMAAEALSELPADWRRTMLVLHEETAC